MFYMERTKGTRISTHTPLAGCNNYAIVVGNGAYDFYSHTIAAAKSSRNPEVSH